MREDFRETIVWLPTLETDADGNAGFTVDFPDNLTRWRLTARAVTLENEVGQATQTVTTTLPVLARLAMPTYLIRGDESQLRVIGQSNLEDTVLAHLGLEAEGLELISAAPDTQLLLAPAARVTADFRVRAAETGTAVVRAEVLTSEASDALRLYTLYTPPEHADGTVQQTAGVVAQVEDEALSGRALAFDLHHGAAGRNDIGLLRDGAGGALAQPASVSNSRVKAARFKLMGSLGCSGSR